MRKGLPELCTFLLDLDGQLTSGGKDEGNWTITRSEERLTE